MPVQADEAAEVRIHLSSSPCKAPTQTGHRQPR